MCKNYQRSRAAAPNLAKLHEDLQTWYRRNSRFLNHAGNAALLQHKDYLSHHLLDTHFLAIEVKQKLTLGEFEIESAVILPHEELKKVYSRGGNADGDAEYARMMESNKRMISRSAEKFGKIGGVMFIVVWCPTGATVIDPLAITQEIIDTRKGMVHRPDWLDTLRASIVNRKEGLYETESAYLAVTRTSGKSKHKGPVSTKDRLLVLGN